MSRVIVVDLRRSWRLIEHIEMMVVGHQLAKSVNVAAIDGVEEADDRGHDRQVFLTHGSA
jgi:hypothetical protein